ncbi:hypothetical protein E2C01_044352 [Portunus trituberculatus]|uniref:Uncharacterized protein n=1 Tax=Portunus trituberculatus TaxID=210409 RepID=A0A5B7FZS3_PORTR|nr:hypothetical protein [Portunus trituberculatus]
MSGQPRGTRDHNWGEDHNAHLNPSSPSYPSTSLSYSSSFTLICSPFPTFPAKLGVACPGPYLLLDPMCTCVGCHWASVRFGIPHTWRRDEDDDEEKEREEEEEKDRGRQGD